MWLYDRAYDQELAALDHVPHGARMVSFVGRPCVEPWAMSRLLHLPGMAIVRREAFSNDQWTMAGAQLLRVRYRPGWPFIRDPTQIVTARIAAAREVWRSIEHRAVELPAQGVRLCLADHRRRHDRPKLTPELRPIWRERNAASLYRVESDRERATRRPGTAPAPTR